MPPADALLASMAHIADLFSRSMDAAAGLHAHLVCGSAPWPSLSNCPRRQRVADTGSSPRWAQPQKSPHVQALATRTMPSQAWSCMASITAPARAQPKGAAVNPQHPPPLAAGSNGLPASLSETAKADVGRATWTLLHTLGAQFPDRPSRQQRKDARMLVDCLTRIYPCGDCARHFAEQVR